MPWTKLELSLVSIAVLLTVLTLGYRTYQHFYFERAAREVTGHIYEIAKATKNYEQKTGRWFPLESTDGRSVQIFPDPFHDDSPTYQGLNEAILERENNHGIVLQLAQFTTSQNATMPVHLFNVPYQRGQPYLRVLIDYGDQSQVETEILMRVQKKLPSGSIAERDDHYYVIDLRELSDAE